VKSAGKNNTPPYYLGPENKPIWFLEQDGMVESGEFEHFNHGDKFYYDEFYNVIGKDIILCGAGDKPLISYWCDCQVICPEDDNKDSQIVCWGPLPIQHIPHLDSEEMCQIIDSGIGDFSTVVDGRDYVMARDGKTKDVSQMMSEPDLGFLYTKSEGPIICQPYGYIPGREDDFPDKIVCGQEYEKKDKIVCFRYVPFHVARVWNSERYPIPTIGEFRWAHKVKAKPEKYLDYFYVKTGNLQFKVSEESQSFADAMSKIPPFYIDEVMRNKLQDLNDIQIMKEYSTFIHQSEDPDKVRDCGSFNPLLV
jgi:hypothetical protein